MSLTLASKTALVTGASRGIGRSIALKLARSGCDVAANYFMAHDEANSLVSEIRAMGRRAVALQADVSSPESVEEMVEAIGKDFDRIDIFVNNAASGVLKPALEMNKRHWRWCMEINALALTLITQRLVLRMPEGGSIIALSSLGATRALPDYAFIGASKAALESLVRNLAQELGPRGIRVNAVSAGPVDTDALRHFPTREQLLSDFARRAPLGPSLSADNVADAVYLLCLSESSMISGHTLVVDGGFSISG